MQLKFRSRSGDDKKSTGTIRGLWRGNLLTIYVQSSEMLTFPKRRSQLEMRRERRGDGQQLKARRSEKMGKTKKSHHSTLRVESHRNYSQDLFMSSGVGPRQQTGNSPRWLVEMHRQGTGFSAVSKRVARGARSFETSESTGRTSLLQEFQRSRVMRWKEEETTAQHMLKNTILLLRC